MGDFGREICRRSRGGGTEGGDRGRILSAGTGATLLPATPDQRLEVHALVAADERTRPLHAADLVRAQGHQIGAERLDVERDAPRGLHGIDMQYPAVAMNDVGRLTNRLDHAGFVVCRHQRNKRTLFVAREIQSLLQRNQIDEAIAVTPTRSTLSGANRPPARMEGCSIAETSSRLNGRLSPPN